MSTPYVGEIRLFAGNFAPNGWALCQGQLLPISENETLFQLIGTTYGGDGQSTFALPDMRGRLPIHQGNGFILAESGGAEQIALTANQIPNHSHPLVGSTSDGNQISPAGHVPANSFAIQPYINEGPDGNFSGAAIASAGGSQPHNNMQPYVCLNFIISLFGIFPSPS